MVAADWIVIALILGCLALGALVGFGAGLKFFTKGIFGIIISIVACVMIGTLFYNVGFIGDLLTKFSSYWAGNAFLEAIHLELVVYYIILFLVVWIVRWLLVLTIRLITNIDNVVIKTLNRVLGAIFFLLIGIVIYLLVFKITGWIGGGSAADFYDGLMGSAFHLDGLFDKINPNWRG